MNQFEIIIVIGPTASGKSEFAVTLAKKYNGEIISADSRQVYKGLNIGTGKVPGKWFIPKNDGRHKKEYMYQNVRHHCIDYLPPKRQYSVAHFKRDGKKAIRDIISRGKTPIICGGTGQFVDSLILDINIPEVAPNPNFRKRMEKKSTSELFSMLQKKDPTRAQSIDPHNPRRLIRALEIIHATGRPVPVVSRGTLDTQSAISNPQLKIFYLNPPRNELYKKIETRLKQRLKQGMIQEVKKLHAKGITWKRMEDLGLEYRYLSRYVRGLITYNEMYTQLLSEIKKYSKRQQTWFRKYNKPANSFK